MHWCDSNTFTLKKCWKYNFKRETFAILVRKNYYIGYCFQGCQLWLVTLVLNSKNMSISNINLLFYLKSGQHCNSVSHFLTWCICYLGNQNWLNATGLIIHLRLWLIMLVSLSALLLNTRSNYLVASTWKNHKKCGGGHLRYHWWYQLYVKTFM